jgi:hypothetical protein
VRHLDGADQLLVDIDLAATRSALAHGQIRVAGRLELVAHRDVGTSSLELTTKVSRPR